MQLLVLIVAFSLATACGSPSSGNGPEADGPLVDASIPDGRQEPDASIVQLPPGLRLDWWDVVGDVRGDLAVAVEVNEAGQVYVLSRVIGTFSVGNDTVTADNQGVLLVKYLADGRVDWFRHYGSSTAVGAYDLALDTNEDLLVTFDFRSDLNLGGISLVNQGNLDIGLLKLSASGRELWAKGFGGAGDEFPETLDASRDTIAIGGSYKEPGTNLGGEDLPASSTGAPHLSPFILVLDGEGNHRWSRGYATEGIALIDGIRIDGDDNVAAVGRFAKTIHIDQEPWNARDTDMFAASYSPSGDLRWARTFGAGSHDTAEGVATDAQGSLYIAARFHGTVDFGGHTLVATDSISSANADGALLKISSAGTVEWAALIGTLGDDAALAVTLDNAGRPVVVGRIEGTLDFGDGPMDGNSNDAFLARFDTRGNHLFSRRLLGVGFTYATAASINDSGALSIVGASYGPLVIDGEQSKHSEGNNYDAFVLYFSPEDAN